MQNAPTNDVWLNIIRHICGRIMISIMADNKTQPTQVDVDTFLSGIDEKRRREAHKLIDMMQKISGTTPVMWGPSIIGFGSKHYEYDTGREGDVPLIGFSPRKSAITVYFNEGFDRYSDLLAKLGKYKDSVSCLYISKLEDIDAGVLHQMLERSYQVNTDSSSKPATVEDYFVQVPAAARPQFDKLRSIVLGALPGSQEVLSYGIVGYKVDDKRARVYISGWADHVAMYPIPKDEALQADLKPYIKGKGTLWFQLDESLPVELIKNTVLKLAE